MPTLNWIGKEAVVKHHKDVPFRLLEPVAELSCGSTDSGNLIVQGDNLHALKADGQTVLSDVAPCQRSAATCAITSSATALCCWPW